MFTLYQTCQTLADTVPVYWDAKSRPFMLLCVAPQYSLTRERRYCHVEISEKDCASNVLKETYSPDEVEIIDSEIPEKEK